MRGRTGRSSSSSSSVGPPPSRMALRKHTPQDVDDLPSGSQHSDVKEDGAPDDQGDDRDDDLSSSLLPRSPRERRRRENKAKEMTEEEMMDLALRLSEHEASVAALRVQKEEEAVLKAIQESMGKSPTHDRAPLAGAEAASRLCSRRKLLYSNRKQDLEVNCSPLNGDVLEAADERRSLKRKRAGSPLLEMPDLSQNISSHASPCSSDPLQLDSQQVSVDLQLDSQQVSVDLQLDSQQVSVDLQLDSQQVSVDLQLDSQQVSVDLQLDSQQVSVDLQLDSQQVSVDLQLDSQQSCDSTQIDEGRSPVFPSTGCRAEVQVPRLSQNLLHSCRTSGFVLCSQDSSDDPQKSPAAQTKSPTFPQTSREVFSEMEAADNSETQLSPEAFQSPVFGRTAQHQKSLSAGRLQVCNSGFTSSSQESLSSSVRSASCRPQSPVFPIILDHHHTVPPPKRPGVCRSPVFSDDQTEQGHVGSLSRVLDRTGIRTKIQRAAAQIREDKETELIPGVTLMRSPLSDEELTEVIKVEDSAETELSSDMKLLWSDGEDAVTLASASSPSPVFPEERDGHPVSPNHTSGTDGVDCSQQTFTSERDPPLLSSPVLVSRSCPLPGASAGRATVQYYWGVPFCPRGLNPDSYTQVILAQMEVYEKSLKEAQRSLLRKVEWGEAVLPQVQKLSLPESVSPDPPEPPEQEVHQRRGLRRRRQRLSEDESPAAEGEEQEDETDGEEERRKETKEEEKKSEGGGQADPDDCDVCPETQLSDEDAALMMDTQSRPERPETPDVQMIPQHDSLLREERAEEDMETDAPVETKVKSPFSASNGDGVQAVRNGEEDYGDAGVEGGRLQGSGSPELDPAEVPQRPQPGVDCPICQGSFPASQIEMHAAYCDGEVTVVHERRPRANCCQDSLKPRRKRTRRTDEEEEETSGKNTEKCFVCQKDVSLRDYGRHTDLCIRRQESKTPTRGSLLSALQHTDGRDSEAGPSGSKPLARVVIDLLDDDEGDGEGDGVPAPSDSPIRAFTPISEASDCLVDFRKQKRVKKTGQRRR